MIAITKHADKRIKERVPGKEELHKEAHTFYGSFRCGRRL